MKDFACQVKVKKIPRHFRASKKETHGHFISGLQVLGKKILFCVFILFITLAAGYIFFISVLPNLYALEHDQNILLTNQDGSQAYLVHFLHDSKMILLEKIKLDLPLHPEDPLFKASLSFKLGALVDTHYVLAEDLELNSVQDLQKFLVQYLLNSKNIIQDSKQLLSFYYFTKDPAINLIVNEQGFNDLASFYLNSDYSVCPMAVLNGTPVSGLGQQYTRVLENSGLRILRLDSALSDGETSIIYYDGETVLCQEIVQRISQILPIKADVNNQEIVKRYRVGMVLVIGKDFIPATTAD